MRVLELTDEQYKLLQKMVAFYVDEWTMPHMEPAQEQALHAMMALVGLKPSLYPELGLQYADGQGK